MITIASRDTFIGSDDGADSAVTPLDLGVILSGVQSLVARRSVEVEHQSRQRCWSGVTVVSK
jgi:hypothetical protein